MRCTEHARTVMDIARLSPRKRSYTRVGDEESGNLNLAVASHLVLGANS